MQIRALAAAAAALVITTAAQADGPPPGPPPPVAVACCVPPALWNGVYFGTHIGSGWSDPTWSFPFVESFSTFPGQSFSPSASGLIWGGHLGINYQFHGFLVVGGEVGYAGNRLSAKGAPFTSAPLDEFRLEGSDLFTLAARFGYVFRDQYLFYGKAGFASSSFELKASSAATGVTAHAQERENGWLIGAGVESRIISNILFGLEYNYIDLSGDRFTGLTGGTAPGGPFNADIGNLHMQTFVARLSILFGPDACCSEGLLGKF